MVKNKPTNAGDVRNAGSILGQEDPLEEGMATHSTILAWRIGHGNPFHYSCLENPMDREAWWATVHRVAESDRTEAT